MFVKAFPQGLGTFFFTMHQDEISQGVLARQRVIHQQVLAGMRTQSANGDTKEKEMNEIIEALQNKAAALQPGLQAQPSLIKDGSYEIALLTTALRASLGDKAGAVLNEIWDLTAKAWSDARL